MIRNNCMHIPLLLTIITFSLPLQGMESHEFTAYKNHCATIQTFLKHEKDEFFEMIYNKNLDPVQELTRINQQFAYYRDSLTKEKNASLLQLKNFHNINDEVWSEEMENLENIKKQVKNYINTKLPDAVHDPIISGENKIFFAKHLKKYDLNIEKICIKRKDARGDELSPFLVVATDEQSKTTTIHINKPEIVISAIQFNQIPSTHQKAALLKLAWVMGNVCPISSAFISFITKKTDRVYNFDTLQKSKDYLSFLTLEQYKLSEILPCLEDSQACQYMEDLRSCSYLYPTSLKQNNEHFQQICIIKNLWEKRKLLEEFIQK